MAQIDTMTLEDLHDERDALRNQRHGSSRFAERIRELTDEIDARSFDWSDDYL